MANYRIEFRNPMVVNKRSNQEMFVKNIHFQDFDLNEELPVFRRAVVQSLFAFLLEVNADSNSAEVLLENDFFEGLILIKVLETGGEEIVDGKIKNELIASVQQALLTAV